MYTMTLADGSKIEGLELNGNNWISKRKLTAADFEGKLKTVSVTDGEQTLEYADQILVQIVKNGKEYWFVLIDEPESDKIRREITELQLALADAYEQMLGGA